MRLRACGCSKKNNLPMLMCNEEMTRHWVECDFCGKSTSHCKSELAAVQQWRRMAALKIKELAATDSQQLNVAISLLYKWSCETSDRAELKYDTINFLETNAKRATV